MNKPCEYCDKADQKKEGAYKCDSPCKQAKQCVENDKKLSEIIGEMFLERR